MNAFLGLFAILANCLFVFGKVSFVKDQSMDMPFPPVIVKSDSGIPEGHLRPLGKPAYLLICLFVCSLVFFSFVRLFVNLYFMSLIYTSHQRYRYAFAWWTVTNTYVYCDELWRTHMYTVMNSDEYICISLLWWTVTNIHLYCDEQTVMKILWYISIYTVMHELWWIDCDGYSMNMISTI